MRDHSQGAIMMPWVVIGNAASRRRDRRGPQTQGPQTQPYFVGTTTFGLSNSSSGEAMKIELYTPAMLPMTMQKAKP